MNPTALIDPASYSELGPLGGVVFVVALFVWFLWKTEDRRAKAWADSHREMAERFRESADACHKTQDRATEVISENTTAVREMSTGLIEVREYLKARNGR